ncbi:zf-HC2 domain-containing protein [Solwaraspora sp. WMMB335]|uniref:zf-HC2 domain-containing protein n=1 Tax=Solwaraspora sp. WMMB335 TaxID=3404118 RepID=UPI003B95CE68
MADGRCGEPQLREALGLFQVGALPDDEVGAVERHLAICADCLAESDRVGEAVMMLALLSPADRDDLVAEFGSPGAGPGTRGTRGTRPNGSAGGSVRPGRDRRRSRRLTLVGAGLAVVLALVVGVTIGQPMLARLSGADAPTTLVADAADRTTGATLSVTVTASGAEVELHATMTGLTVDEPYRLYVTDVDGRSWELASVTGVGRPQKMDTTCPVPIDRLVRFSITASDGSLAVTASVQLHPPSAPPD